MEILGKNKLLKKRFSFLKKVWNEKHCFLIMTFTHKCRADVSYYCRYTEAPSGTRTQTESVCTCVYMCVWLMRGQKVHLCSAFSQCLFACMFQLSHLGSSNTTSWLWPQPSFSLVSNIVAKAKAPIVDINPFIVYWIILRIIIKSNFNDIKQKKLSNMWVTNRLNKQHSQHLMPCCPDTNLSTPTTCVHV